jgi:hypothetical protein
MGTNIYGPVAAIILMTASCLPGAVAATPKTNPQNCIGIQRRVLGYWKLRSGDPGLFDEMEFRADPGDTPRFNSWLHMRLDTSNAIWGARKCHIDITTAWQNGGETHITVISLTRDKLRVRYEGDKPISTYRRNR